MRKPRLLYYENLDFQPDTLGYIQEYFEFMVLKDPGRDRDEIVEKADASFAPMGFLFDMSKIERCRALKVIGTPTTGTPHIDTDFALKKNIAVVSLKDQQDFLSTITPTAELAWGLILSVTRYIPWAHESVCEGRWDGKSYGERTPRMLSNMSLGIVGLGRLGSLVAGYAKASQMDVFYFDPYVKNSHYERCDNLYTLAEKSDIVSVHVHLSEATEDLIERRFMESMPRGSYLINTARGGIVNEEALLVVLNSGHLAGVGLDMLADEHLPGFQEELTEHPLVQYANTHDNLVLTPKMGGCTIDAWGKTEMHVVNMMIQELKDRGVM